ncbi:GGDEF domain-containing protein [Campylobacter sp. CCUG 57310]|uniref:GGDEF domain-containing protein n=1 Tax=Campylobacter sp. CCUG 57310 TaxID=2517362 RepID=UPI00156573E5|nr:GGDEF domain-containing protein [Campylobacter sp. CCUG 57310]QKF91830.1 diguanylate cyclase [Campylobacter sp. CCUG 57310]
MTTKYNISNIQYRAGKNGQNQVYNFLLLLFVFINIIICIFLIIQNIDFKIITVYLITALITFGFYYQRRSSKEVVIYWVHGAVVFHAVFGILLFGWGYGIENIFIWAIGANYFMILKRNFFSFAIMMFEATLYLILYLYRDSLGMQLLDEKFKEGCYIFLFLCIFTSFLKRTMALGSMHVQNFEDIKMKSDKAKEISEHDYLTGLKNRLIVEDHIKDMLKIYSNQGKTYGGKKEILIALADIDNFKNINDTFGHTQGDEVLKATAGALSENFRADEDVVSRWGGEEFLIAAFISNKCDAEKILNRILRKVNMIKTPDDKGVGVTFGAIILSDDVGSDVDIKQIIKSADELLYEGKKEGKNRVKIKKWAQE